MTIIDTNAPALRDKHGDIIGYDIPDEDPVSVETRWIRKWGREDELVYVVTWANGITADVFTLNGNPRWEAVARATYRKRWEEGLRKLDNAIAQAGKPLNSEAA